MPVPAAEHNALKVKFNEVLKQLRKSTAENNRLQSQLERL